MEANRIADLREIARLISITKAELIAPGLLINRRARPIAMYMPVKLSTSMGLRS